MSFPVRSDPKNWYFVKFSGWVFQDLPIRVKNELKLTRKINYNCSQVHHCLYCVWPVNFIHVHFIPFISFGRFQEKSRSKLLFIPILQDFSCSGTRSYLCLHCRKLSSMAAKYQHRGRYLYIMVYMDQCNFWTLVQLYFLRKI